MELPCPLCDENSEEKEEGDEADTLIWCLKHELGFDSATDRGCPECVKLLQARKPRKGGLVKCAVHGTVHKVDAGCALCKGGAATGFAKSEAEMLMLASKVGAATAEAALGAAPPNVNVEGRRGNRRLAQGVVRMIRCA